MAENSIFQLLTPIMCLAFSAAFFTIFLYNKKKTAAALYAVSYLLGSLAFIVEIYRFQFNPYVASYLSNTLYLTTLAFLVTGMAKHFSKPVPYKTILFIPVTALALMSWYLLVEDNMPTRTIIMNFGAGMMFLPVFSIIPRKNCAPIYKFIFWITALTFIQFFLRPIITLMLEPEPLTAQNYGTSMFLVAFHFSITLAAVALALSLCFAIGMEEIIDMQRLSEIDELSGLVNRRGLEVEVSRHIALAHERKVPLSLIVCDIDHFKRVNDTYGHTTGDRIIKEFGKIIKNSCRRSDLVARVGGEEFCILLPIATKEMAYLVANNARELFSQKSFKDIPKGEIFTASFGIAQIEENDTYQDLFKRADAALYQAKQTGRNKSVIAGGRKITGKAEGMKARARRT